MSNTTQEILEHDRRRRAAMLDRDTKTLDALIDERLRFVHTSGSIDTKKIYLEKAANPPATYMKLDFTDTQVTDLGDTALLSGKMRSHMKLKGEERTIENYILMVWTRAGAGWRLVAFQPTPVPQA